MDGRKSVSFAVVAFAVVGVHEADGGIFAGGHSARGKRPSQVWQRRDIWIQFEFFIKFIQLAILFAARKRFLDFLFRTILRFLD